MKLSKIQSFIRSRKKSSLISAGVAPVILVLLMVSFAHIAKANFASWGDPGTYLGCVNSGNSTGVAYIVSSSCDAGDSEITWLKDVDAGIGLSISRSSSGATLSLADSGVTTAKIADQAVTTAKLSNDVASGWYAANETWAHASSDAPTFTFTVSGDDTGKYSPGMRVKLTQSSITEYPEYFIITAVSYSSPNTTVTVYGGTDYTLANATITNPYYSPNKAPQDFPLDPTKWQLKTTVTSQQDTLSPSANTWYNTGSTSITLPIGIWNVSVKGLVEGYKPGASASNVQCTLSTANNSESDSDMTQYETTYAADTYLPFFIQKNIGVAAKTTYYFNLETGGSSYYGIHIRGDYTPLVIRAVSAYL